MHTELSVLEIRLLIKCNKSPLSKRDVTQIFRHYAKSERDEAVHQLLQKELIHLRLMPKEGSGRTPTFYFITDKGKQWLTEYNATFPKT